MRLPGMKVSDLLKAADDYGMWDSSGAEFLNKVKELTAGTKFSFAEKCMGATPSEYVFVSWSHAAECGLGAAIALVADMLEPDDHVFIDILCFPHNENDPKFYEGIYSVFMDALSQCRCILAAADLQGALNAAINAYFALAEPRPDAMAFVAAQLQMRGAQRNPGARRGASAVNVSEM